MKVITQLDAQREAARQRDGRFGTQPTAEADVDLARTRIPQAGSHDRYPVSDLDNVISGDIEAAKGWQLRLGNLDGIGYHFRPDNLDELRTQVAADGEIRSRLVAHVHPDGTVVLRDGHHRYIVARELDLDVPIDFHHGVTNPETGEVEFPTDAEW